MWARFENITTECDPRKSFSWVLLSMLLEKLKVSNKTLFLRQNINKKKEKRTIQSIS